MSPATDAVFRMRRVPYGVRKPLRQRLLHLIDQTAPDDAGTDPLKAVCGVLLIRP